MSVGVASVGCGSGICWMWEWHLLGVGVASVGCGSGICWVWVWHLLGVGVASVDVWEWQCVCCL